MESASGEGGAQGKEGESGDVTQMLWELASTSGNHEQWVLSDRLEQYGETNDVMLCAERRTRCVHDIKPKAKAVQLMTSDEVNFVKDTEMIEGVNIDELSGHKLNKKKVIGTGSLST